jgi:nucleoid DNA-binding protein
MAIKVKAVERNISFDKTQTKYAYVLQMDELYSRLSASKVIGEAALRSGISRGAINAAWDAIGEVVKAWATEGHSVAIPGLGTMRFGIRSTSVGDVAKVSNNLITSRRVIFSPSVDIRKELQNTSISITCFDRDGKMVKQVTSADDGTVEDNDGESTQYNVTLTASPANGGTLAGAGLYNSGAAATLVATAAAGYAFQSWSDGNTSAQRILTVDKAYALTATFTSTGETGGSTTGGETGGSTSGGEGNV